MEAWEYTLDGVTNQEVTLQRGEAEIPSLDATRPVQSHLHRRPGGVQSARPDDRSQQERNQPASRRGSSSTTAPRAPAAKAFFGGALPRPPYERNEYGGNLSGPIFIPKLYDGRDSSFFFFAFEGFRLSQSTNVNSQQPTLAERSGDFSAFLVNGGCAADFRRHYTWLTRSPADPHFQITRFLPQVQLRWITQLLNILYPLPTKAGTGTNTFQNVYLYQRSHPVLTPPRP